MNRFKQTRNLLRRLTSIPSASLGFSKMCLPRYFSISMAKVGQKRRKWQLLYTTLTTSVRQNIYTHRVWAYCRYNIAENFLRLTLYWEDLAQDLASSREVHMFSARTQEDNTDNCAQPTNPSQLCEQSRNHQTYMWVYHKKYEKNILYYIHLKGYTLVLSTEQATFLERDLYHQWYDAVLLYALFISKLNGVKLSLASACY